METITKLVIYEAPFVVDDSQPPTPPTYLDDLRAADQTHDVAPEVLTPELIRFFS